MLENSSVMQHGYNLIEKIAELANDTSYDIDYIVNIALEELKNIYGFSYLRVVKRNGIDYSFTTLFHSSGFDEKADCKHTFPKSVLCSVIKKGNRYIIYDDEKIISDSNIRESYGFYFKSLIQFPIFYHDYLIGVFELFDFETERQFEKNRIFFIETIIKVLMQYMYEKGAFDYIEEKKENIDFVSGMPKFESFSKVVNKKITEESSDSWYVMVCSDINQFKYLNESFGFSKGDTILHITAEKIFENKYVDSVSRIHSDNFVYILDLKDAELHSESKIDFIIKDLNKSVVKTIEKAFHGADIRFSTGVYIIGDNPCTVGDAYTKANLARKNAKYSSKGSVCFYDEKMMELIRREEELKGMFASAMKNKNLIVYYQPKISCRDEKAAGGEALIRWRKDDGTFIYPDEFISLFEKSGNIIELDYYVYNEVFAYIRKRLDENKKVLPISMNVSRSHLETDHIIQYILKLFDEYKIPPELIEFELTENIYMSNISNAKKFLEFCKSIGVFVSMDDFGSGYSSLNVMNSLPIDILKLDKVFLKNDDLTDNDMIVIECVVSMAKKLKMKVVCEGVETESQSEFLKRINCDEIQGYFYGKPMDEESFNRYIESH